MSSKITSSEELDGSPARKVAKRAKRVPKHAIESVEDQRRKVRSYVQNHPLVAAALAFAAGALLGALARR